VSSWPCGILDGVETRLSDRPGVPAQAIRVRVVSEASNAEVGYGAEESLDEAVEHLLDARLPWRPLGAGDET
jgi:hypothetical protein